VVPIVIRNSDSVAGRNSTTLHPGTVDVAVLPPVDVSGWTAESLGERIEKIRSAYVELLASWPAGGLGGRSGMPS
jgi:putative phosphoserine phosphatase/1-acylglycerol-3-phosphate O-acyltransferase